jgi:hypothetical protein
MKEDLLTIQEVDNVIFNFKMVQSLLEQCKKIYLMAGVDLFIVQESSLHTMDKSKIMHFMV